MLIKFEGVDSRPEAEALRGGALYIGPEDLRDLGEDEYWPHELIGYEVVLASGGAAGEVSRIVPGTAQDLLAVFTESGEKLIPLVKAIVVDVSPESGRVVIDPPEGLLD